MEKHCFVTSYFTGTHNTRELEGNKNTQRKELETVELYGEGAVRDRKGWCGLIVDQCSVG